MLSIRILDNGGETADRYTVFIEDSEETTIYTMSDNANMPNGVNMYHKTTALPPIGTYKQHNEIDFIDLPNGVKKAIVERIKHVFVAL